MNTINAIARRRNVKPWLWIIGAVGCLALLILQSYTWKHSTPSIEVRRDALILRDGRLHRLNEVVPFSGLMSEFYPNGKLQSRLRVSKGLLNGLSEGWHTNGQLQIQECFVAGVSHGIRTKWHANGQKLSEANIVQGKMEGWFHHWNEEGSLIEAIPMKAGQPDGIAMSFFSSGFIKAEARLRNGHLLENHYWKDGERAYSLQMVNSMQRPNTR